VRYLLDTNICIALIHRAEQKLIGRLRARKPRDLVLCSIVKAELRFGARKSQRVTDNLEKLDAFFSPFESIPFDDRAADFYGSCRSLLSDAGTPIGGNDLMIAAIALANDLIVVTRNQKEFARVAGLKWEPW
jgi:tRNA(fMet)-specific endonuclease VapC